MRIKSVRLKNYKRFTELAIADLPETARLVVLVGPNGTGKSSVFDSFLLKAKPSATPPLWGHGGVLPRCAIPEHP